MQYFVNFRPLVFSAIMLPFIFKNDYYDYFALAMDSERRYSGAASAVLGCVPFLIGGVISPFVGLGDIFIATSIAMAVCAAMVIVVYRNVKAQSAE